VVLPPCHAKEEDYNVTSYRMPMGRSFHRMVGELANTLDDANNATPDRETKGITFAV
jgi:hypothetical protein